MSIYIYQQIFFLGTYGFLLPPDQIIPTAEETWAFHLTVAREIFNRVGSSTSESDATCTTSTSTTSTSSTNSTTKGELTC